MNTDNLLNKKISIECANQYEKAKDDGFDIYFENLNPPHDTLRKFRLFLKENLKPVFDNSQLYEIMVGYIYNNVDVLQYAFDCYNGKEMNILRKALIKKQDINIIKQNGLNEKHMQEISIAMDNGINADEFKKYNQMELEFINNYFKKKIDTRPYFEAGYDLVQIETILIVEKTSPDILNYITPEYDHYCIRELSMFLKDYNYEDIKKVFDPRYSLEQLHLIYQTFKKHDKYLEIMNPDFNFYKMHGILLAYDLNINQELIDKFKSLDLDYNRCSTICTLLHNGFWLEDYMLDENISIDKLKILRYSNDNDVFKEICYLDYSLFSTHLIINAYRNTPPTDILPYINDTMNDEQIKNTYDSIFLINTLNLKADEKLFNLVFDIITYNQTNEAIDIEDILMLNCDFDIKKKIANKLMSEDVNQMVDAYDMILKIGKKEIEYNIR